MQNWLSALGLVLGSIVVLRYGWSLLARPGASGDARLRVAESCALGPKQRLHVVEVDGERLLVASAETGISLIRRLPSTLPATKPDSEPDVKLESARGEGARRRGALRGLAGGGLVLALLIVPALSAVAQEGDPSGATSPLLGLLSLPDVEAATRPGRISNTLEIVALLTLISIAPSILLMGTCFTRVVIVLALLRQAIGIQQLPPNQILVGLALFITLGVMAPVGQRMHDEGLAPYLEERIDAGTAFTQGMAPAREFLLHHTREKDVALFVSLAPASAGEEDEGGVADLRNAPLSALLPAYMMSEMRTAFEIGFMLFLPFLVIDLVIASMLISMGMIVLPPIVISLPFKIMLFVLLDGWNLIVGSLLEGLR